MTTTAEVELVGILRELAGKKSVSLKFDRLATVGDVITELANRFQPKFKQAMIDPELNDPRPNVLILLNKTEISALNGLDTKIRDGDKLVLIPVSHGG